MTAMAPLLEARSISKSFGGVRALDHIDVSINCGEVVGVIGPNELSTARRRVRTQTVP